MKQLLFNEKTFNAFISIMLLWLGYNQFILTENNNNLNKVIHTLNKVGRYNDDVKMRFKIWEFQDWCYNESKIDSFICTKLVRDAALHIQQAWHRTELEINEYQTPVKSFEETDW